MRKTLVLLLVGALVAGIAALAFLLGEGRDVRSGAPSVDAPGETSPGAELAAAADIAAAGSESAEVSPLPDEGRTEVGAAAPKGWTARGRVGLGLDAWAADTPVRVKLHLGVSPGDEPVLEEVVRTDADGHFSWSPEPPAPPFVVEAKPDVEDALSYRDWERVLPGDGEPDPLSCRIYPYDVTYTGEVRGADGEPLAGASVKARSSTVETGADGMYSLRGSSFISQEYLYAWGEGHAEMRAVAEPPAPGNSARVDFVLRREFRVEGRIVDELERPLEGVLVQTFFSRHAKSTTGPDGRYALGHLDPGRDSHHVYARLEGYVEAGENVEPGAKGVVGLDLVMERGSIVRGYVFTEAGDPVHGAVLFIGFSPHAYNRLDALSDADGAFEFTGVPPGAQELWTEREGLSPDRRTIQVPAPDAPPLVFEVRLGAGHFAAGIALDGDGKPFERLWVSPRHRREYVGGRTLLEPDGSFRVEGLPASEVDLEFWGRGVVRENVFLDAVDVDDLRITLSRAGGLAGRVVDGVTGEPLPRFRVRFVSPALEPGDDQLSGYSATWSREGHVFDGTDGYWSTDDAELEPGSVTGVEVRADGYAPTTDSHVVVQLEPDRDALVFRMLEGRELRGRVIVDASGEPVANAKVSHRTPGARIGYGGESTYDALIAHTDVAGWFQLNGVPAGETLLLVEHPDHPPHVDGPFEVPESTDPNERLIQLGVGGVIEGVVRTAAGSPVAEAALSVSRSGDESLGYFHEQIAAGDDGRFRIAGLAAGTYQVSFRLGIDDKWVNALTAFARVESGATTEVELRPRGSATVHGTLTSADDLPAKPIGVNVMRVDRPEPTLDAPVVYSGCGALAVDGAFVIEGLEAGTWHLSVYHWDSGTASQLMGSTRVTVDAGSSANVSIEMKRP